jgi:hypothetical protein
MTFLYDPGRVTVEMVCEHGKFTSSLVLDGPVIRDDEADGVAAVAAIVEAGHHREFGCDCDIDTLINGEVPLQ